MVDSSSLTRLVQLIYDASLNPKLWTEFLDEAAARTRSTHSLLLLLDQNSLSKDVVLVQGLDPAIRAEYQNRVDEDVWANSVLAKPSGRTWLSEELVKPRDLHKTAFYADIAAPSECEHNVVTAISDSTPKMVFSCIRGKKQGAFGEVDRKVLESLAPHLANARRIHHRFTGTLSLLQGLKKALDQSPYGVALLGIGGVVEYMNAGMDKLLASNVGLGLLNNRLQFKRLVDQQRFEERIRSVVGSLRDTDIVRKKFYLGPVTLADCEITVVPLSVHSEDALTHKPSCLVYINHAVLHDSVSLDALINIFRLTPAEAKLCKFLVLSGSLTDAASARGISVNTAKTHIKSIFQKCDVRSRSQLVERVKTSLAALAER